MAGEWKGTHRGAWRTAAVTVGAVLALSALLAPRQAVARMTPQEWREVAAAEGYPVDPANPDSTQKGGPQGFYRLDCTYVHNVGRLWLLVNNFGQLGEEFGDFYTACLSAEWPAGSGNEYLYVAGPWIGAMHEEAGTAGGIIDVPRVSTTCYQHEFRPSRDVVDDIRSTYEGAPHGTRIGGSSDLGAANDDGDRDPVSGAARVDEDFLNGKDDDGDGRIDEDFAAISQQMYSFEVRDDTPEAKARFQEHVPLGVKLQQSSYAWSTAGTNDFVGIDYKFTNVSTSPMKDVFIAFFVDADIGPYSNPNNFDDDRFDKIDTLVTLADPTGAIAQCTTREFRLQMAYMWDQPDNPTQNQGQLGGDAPGYAGTLLLGHTVDPLNNPLIRQKVPGYAPKGPGEVSFANVQYFSGTGGNPYAQGGDPATDEERYDLMCAHCLVDEKGEPKYKALKDKAYATPPQAKDFRYLISVGPFSRLNPDSAVTMSVAYVVGEGRQGLIENATNLLGIVWEGDWWNVDNDMSTGYVPANSGIAGTPAGGYIGHESCIAVPPAIPGQPSYDISLDVDCVARDSAGIAVRIKGDVCTAQNYVNLDCDPLRPDASLCTPNPKYPGGEYWRHWVSTTPPPPPASNLRMVSGNPAFVYAVPKNYPPQGISTTTGVAKCITATPSLDSTVVDHKMLDDFEFRSCAVTPGQDRRVELVWDNSSELIGNPVNHLDDFRGYRVWRAANWKRPVGTIGPDRSQWELLADYARPLHEDSTLAVTLALLDHRPVGYQFSSTVLDKQLSVANPTDTVLTALQQYFNCGSDPYRTGYPNTNKGWLNCITDTTVNYPVLLFSGSGVVADSALVQPAQPASGGRPAVKQVKIAHYPVGRYRYVDTSVINGMPYFYALSAYRLAQGNKGKEELHSLAVATEQDLVVPQTISRSALAKGGVRVVPNPYIDHADWDLTPAATGYLSPTGTKLEFQGLPRGKYTIRIFTLSGDLVKQISSDDPEARRVLQPEEAVTDRSHIVLNENDGAASWNLVTRNGQDVTSGVYVYTVEAPAQSTISGKFIVVRGKGITANR